jgi:hypothetical protein
VLESFYEVERPRLAEFMRAAIALRRRNGNRTTRLRALEIYTLERPEKVATAAAVINTPTTPIRTSNAAARWR